jgi:hypothetical protein
MKIFYLPNGEIHQIIYARDDFLAYIDPATSVLGIDEIPENKELCRDLSSYGQLDENGLGRWYIENGELFERDNWGPAVNV